MNGPYNHGWMFDGGIGMLFGGLWMILILGVIFLLVAALLKYLNVKPRDNQGRSDGAEIQTPLDVLKMPSPISTSAASIPSPVTAS